MAATKDLNTEELAPGRKRGLGLATNQVIHAGTIACVNSSGWCVKGATSATLRTVGVFRQRYDSTGIANGGLVAEPEIGVFGPFKNSASADEITNADIGTTCYVVDDETVAKTHNSNARSAAGRVWQVTAAGVWVDFR